VREERVDAPAIVSVGLALEPRMLLHEEPPPLDPVVKISARTPGLVCPIP